MIAQDLSGLTVINTRPKQQSQRITEHLHALGADCISLPAIDIQPIEDFDLEAATLSIENSDLIIFTSAHALLYLNENLLSLLQQKLIFAIGKATASSLQAEGFSNIILPAYPSSQSLLDLVELKCISNKKILICCGENPKTLLKEALQHRGALVSYLFCYRRVAVLTYLDKELAILQQKKAQVILSFSLQSLEAFFHASMPLPYATLQDYYFVVINKAMADYCVEHDIHNILIAKSAQLKDVMAILQSWWYKFHKKQLQ